MAYGTVYHAIGWIIAPTSQGATFVYDATGHVLTGIHDGRRTCASHQSAILRALTTTVIAAQRVQGTARRAGPAPA